MTANFLKSRSKNTVGGAVLVLAMAALAAPAQAEDTEGPYVRIDGGYSVAGNGEIATTAPIGVNTKLDDGYLVSGAFGYATSAGFRIEGEVSHRWNKLKPSTTLDRDGKVSATSLMLNGYFEFGGSDSMVRPYVGAGAGVAFTRTKAKNSTPVIPVSIDDKSTSFAYQLMGGVAVDVSKDVTLDVGYRYFAAPSIKGVTLAPPATSTAFESDYKQHAVTVGLRFGF